jgi:hypothetical protein
MHDSSHKEIINRLKTCRLSNKTLLIPYLKSEAIRPEILLPLRRQEIQRAYFDRKFQKRACVR